MTVRPWETYCKFNYRSAILYTLMWVGLLWYNLQVQGTWVLWLWVWLPLSLSTSIVSHSHEHTFEDICKIRSIWNYVFSTLCCHCTWRKNKHFFKRILPEEIVHKWNKYIISFSYAVFKLNVECYNNLPTTMLLCILSLRQKIRILKLNKFLVERIISILFTGLLQMSLNSIRLS